MGFCSARPSSHPTGELPLATLRLQQFAHFLLALGIQSAIALLLLQFLESLLHHQPVELGDGIHSCAYGHYVIVFESDPPSDAVVIVRVLHGARDIPTAFGADAE